MNGAWICHLTSVRAVIVQRHHVCSTFESLTARRIVPHSPFSEWQSTGYIPIPLIFTICPSPPGKFHSQHPPIPSSPPHKMGFLRLQERKLPGLRWETFAVNAVIDLMGPLWLLWSGITLFYHRMHLVPLGLTAPSIRFRVKLMKWLETNGQVPFSPPVRQNAPSNVALTRNSPRADICMRLKYTQQVDLWKWG